MLRDFRLSTLAETALPTLVASLGLLLCTGCLFRIRSDARDEQRVADERARAALAFKSSVAKGQQRLSIQELDQLTYGFADRYFMLISSAVDAIKRGNSNPAERRAAHQIKLNGVLAINDIVSGNDPYAQTLDLVVSVTLESILLIDENRAEEVFGERAHGLIKAIRTLRIEVWELAAKILTQDQLELLDYIILEWRRTHPEVDQVSFVKFDNFASARAAGLLEDLKSGGGFLAPVSEASKVLKDWARITERAFWYSKRAPNIAAIQAEGAVNEILSAPEIGSILQTADQLGQTAESLPGTIDAQRSAIFADLDARQTLLTNTLRDVRYIVADVNALGSTLALLTTNLQQTLLIIDQVGRTFGVDKPSINQPARPFDIQDYTLALTRLNEVVTNVHRLSQTAEQLPQSAGWQTMLRDMTDATDRRVDRAFTRICVALGLAFLLAVAYCVVSLKLKRRMTHSLQEIA